MSSCHVKSPFKKRAESGTRRFEVYPSESQTTVGRSVMFKKSQKLNWGMSRGKKEVGSAYSPRLQQKGVGGGVDNDGGLSSGKKAHRGLLSDGVKFMEVKLPGKLVKQGYYWRGGLETVGEIEQAWPARCESSRLDAR